jgi:flagellum-specific peptidoglycan hydrolase FlgJ
MSAPQNIINAALAAKRKWGVPASVSLAQWALESGYGAHAPGHNSFGMKPRSGKNDPCQVLSTTEWSALRRCYVPTKQPFRVFPSDDAAFDAHAELLATAGVYARARAALPNVGKYIDGLMPVRNAKGVILKPGYATDPLYASKLKALIAKEGWGKYDA